MSAYQDKVRTISNNPKLHSINFTLNYQIQINSLQQTDSTNT